MSKRDVLLEIGLEEVPARFVRQAAEQLQQKLEKWLEEARIAYDSVTWYGTPRRLAVIVKGTAERQADLEEEARGPAKRIAVNDDGWTKAALGFARGQGVVPEQLFFQEYKGEEYVFARKKQAGRATEELLAAGFQEIVTSLTFPKNMRWGDNSFRFVRPIRWLVAMFGSDVISLEIAGVKAGNITYGHRFLGSEASLPTASDYVQVLRDETVIVSAAERKAMIREQLQQLAAENAWDIPIDEQLLEEVTFLVEYPTAVAGAFDAAYLELPEDVLITSMREHQRYFPVKSPQGDLLPHFITVRNGGRGALANVVKGNEKVLSARLADARFFYEEDKKRSPSFYNEKLTHVVFHEALGTIADKVRRVRRIAAGLADRLHLSPQDKAAALQTAELCKFDLETHMVNEFPELQGRMGERYAALAGEDPAVAKGIFEHYLPRFTGDVLPATAAGQTVALADKIDTVAACFGIGIVPTGSQDPYALRRQATGIVQILRSLDVDVSLEELFALALDALVEADRLGRARSDVAEELASFFRQRLKHALQSEGIRYDVIDAVLGGTAEMRPGLIVAKAKRLETAAQGESFKRTVEAFTRVDHLAAKVGKAGTAYSETLFEHEAERRLAAAFYTAKNGYEHALAAQDADAMYGAIAALETDIHHFFDDVMVMVDDEAVRSNRLALLAAVAELVGRFAQFNAIVLAS
ncbi:glycine--tRNA ligase subunit beta [Numidum massiliense]|uniref:glycine--tRNA ligase subunit beta n=1 Tax=Numidum massiliense TaxID=1522315 RepID=UPI0006D58D12|nr:glycine--tRNA ligase subunit beta [Numidum massiliense]